MAMTNQTIKQQEQFDALVQKTEKYVRREPAQYRLRVGLLAVLGYAYIFSVLALLSGMVWALRQAMVSRGGTYAVDQVNVIASLFGLGIIRLFWVSFPRPKGLELNSKQVPKLFALVDELRVALNTPKFDHILLTDEQNAGVLQIPRLGFLGWQRNYLLLGLPLMQSLSPQQFRAVVAHELGHLSGNHSRFAGWIYRVRKIWFHLAKAGNSFLFNWFFNWYEPFFRAYSFVLARADEYEADRFAANLADAHNVANALSVLAINRYFLQKSFWPDIYKQAANLEEPPDGTITKLLCKLQSGVDSKMVSTWFGLALAKKTDNEDTHPCLSERLQALRYGARVDQLPVLVQPTAAEHFFGEALDSFAVRLDDHWKKEAEKIWKTLHIQALYQKRNLEALSRKAQNHPLTVEETWKRAYLTCKFEGNEASISLFQNVLARSPEHALANYQLGQILLEQQDAKGTDYLKSAMERDASLVIPCCELLYGFYQQLEQPEEAQAYLQRMQQHQVVWYRAQQDRNDISASDRFESHDLPEVEVQQIAEQLSTFPEVREVYLVRKVVARFPEKPFYVLGISRRYVAGAGANYKSDWELSNQLQAELNFSGEVYLFIFSQSTIKVKNALRRVTGALIYRY